jgi:acetyl-CoA carboxylase biotin carboxylase subunit
VISRLLIANRGEIAVRVARACRELGIEAVAVHSTADRGSLVTELADQSVQIGPQTPRRSYLYAPALIEAARRCGADAVHPGYGFLSEDPDFAEICVSEGLTFVGPPPDVMSQIGDKARVRRLMADAGLPILPGTPEPMHTLRDGLDAAARIGYPVIIKAATGGGGRGMAPASRPEEFIDAFESTRAHARSVFGDPSVYIERYLTHARHVEVQVLCDGRGNGVHLGERDCSVQRRHAKLLEESPCGLLDEATRARIGELAVRGALAVGFVGAGTMEFLLDEHGALSFMEINARIQVEHPVTEMCTGVDLVREQILIAAGAPLSRTQGDIRPTGTAIECRINAEDPRQAFAPAPAQLTRLELPQGPWTRVDTGYRRGDRLSPCYDSLLAKVIVWAPDRAQAISRMDRALAEFVAEGPGLATTLDLHRGLLRHPLFRADRHTTAFLDDHLPAVLDPAAPEPVAPLPAVSILPLASTSTFRSAHRADPSPHTPSPRIVREPSGGIAMPSTTFTLPDLLDLLTLKAGLAPADRTDDPSATLERIGLDSLAFLALQTELHDRFGFELPEDRPISEYTLGEMVDHVNERLGASAVRADAS